MPEVIVALGANMGDRLARLHDAARFLDELSSKPVRFSRIYESEAVGPGTHPFLNAAAAIWTPEMPRMLYRAFKDFEISQGRAPDAPRWSDRPIDLDLIGWGRRRFRNAAITVPHASYRERLFVLLPLQDLRPEWVDPEDGRSVDELIAMAPKMAIFPTDHSWPHL